MSFGTVTHFDASATVRFDRTVSVPPEHLWTALTDSAVVTEWLTACRLETRLGGAVHLDFGEDQQVHGRITRWEPPNVLEYTWTFPDEPDSVLLLEVGASADGARLVLEHRTLPSEQAAGYGAGWHAHLDSLEALLSDRAPVDWDDRFQSVLSRYAGA